MTYTITSVSGLAPYIFDVVALVDGVTTTTYKPFLLGNNKLDGTYLTSSLPIPNIAWFSGEVCDNSGVFTSPPTLKYVPSPAPDFFGGLVITGHNQLNEYPTAVRIKGYFGNVELYSVVHSGNTSLSWTIPANPQLYMVDYFTLEILSWNVPNAAVKLLETEIQSIAFVNESVSYGLGTVESNDIGEVFEFEATLPISIVTSANVDSVDAVSSDSYMVDLVTDTTTSVTASDAASLNVGIAVVDDLVVYIVEYLQASIDITASTDVIANTTESVVYSINSSASDEVNASMTEDTTYSMSINTSSTVIVMVTEFIDVYLAPIISAVADASMSVSTTYGINAIIEPDIRNIHSLMDAPFRRVHGKVEITFSDPFLDESITASASEIGRWTDPSQTTDNVNTTAYKWFSLQDNKLDGSYHPMPGNLTSPSVGWWGVTASDANGSFSTPIKLTITFEPRPVYNLLCSGDDMLNEYPVDFMITLYDSTDTVLYVETVTGNQDVTWTKPFESPVAPVVKMVLSVTRINKPARTVKIVEFYTAVKQTYYDEDILSIGLLEEQVYRNVTLPIGNISSNEIDIRIRNVNSQFNPANKLSPLYGLLKKNRRIKAWLGVEIIEGEIEWSPLGQFWSVDWDTPNSGTYVSVSARDRLDLLRYSDFTISQVYHNYTLYQLAEMVLQDIDLQGTDYYIDPHLNSIVVEYSWFDRMSHREALTIIAGAATGRVYCNRDGQIVIDAFLTPPDTFYEFTDERSIIDVSYPLAWSEITNYVEVMSIPRKLTAVEEVYNLGAEIITVEASSVQSETFIFSDLPVTDVLAPTCVFSSTDLTITSWESFAWGIIVEFTNNSLANQTVTEFKVKGKRVVPNGTRVVVAKDDRSIRDNTKQKYDVSNDFIQSTSRAADIANNILNTYKDPRHDASLDTRGHIALRLGDRVTIPDGAGGNSQYFITRQKLDWDGALRSRVEAQIINS